MNSGAGTGRLAGDVAGADLWEVVRQALGARDSGHPEHGIELIRTAMERHPGHSTLWQVLGLLYRAREDLLPALEALHEAARLSPTDPKIAHALARTTMEAGHSSLDLFENARRLAPLDGDLLVSRAAGQLAEGKGKEAMEELDALLGTNPNWVEGHAALANLRWMLGERDIFTQSFESALAGQPNNMKLWLALIARLMHAEKYAGADEAVQRARQAAGPNLALDVSEAVCAAELGDVARADRLFEQLAAVSDPALTARYVRHLLRTGRVDEAAKLAHSLIGGPEEAQAWPYLAVCWRLLGDERWHWLEGDPRLVGVYDIMERADLGPLKERLRSLHNTVSDPIGQSVRGGTQTDGPLFARVDPEIRALRALIVQTVQEHIAKFEPIDPSHPILRHGKGSPVRFAGSWSVRLSGGGSHTQHIHQQGWISSAFYVTVPDEEEMGAAPTGWLSLGAPPADLAIDLAPFRMIEPKPGRLILFPSITWHGTIPYRSGERMTVAFDIARPPREAWLGEELGHEK